MVELVAIINSFNRLHLLRDAVASLCKALRQVPSKTAVIVFEAGSTDGSAEWLAQFAVDNPEVDLRVIEAKPAEASSFSAGENAACALALKLYPTCRWFFLFETDNWLASAEPILKAIEFLERRPDVAAAGFTVRKHSGQPAGFGCRLPTVWQFLVGPHITCWLRLESPRQKELPLCDVVYTSPLLVRCTAWEQSGGFDADRFPFSDCDLDWAWRLRKMGWRMAVIQTNAVVHDNRESLSQWSSSRVLHFHRSRLKLLERHQGAWVRLFKPLLLLRHCIEWFVLWLSSWPQRNRADSLDKRASLIKTVLNSYEQV
ncbi:MAG: glycosyltransferase family 2 protein [Bryobacteraceae bacterium]|nr:glycosyltransferase family 2 protein [Bryobacteraceae bacterium]